MSQQKLTSKIRDTLKEVFGEYGMTDKILNDIEKKSPTLVSLLNNSQAKFIVNLNDVDSHQENGIFGGQFGGKIEIGLKNDRDRSIQRILLLLAHELGHEQGKFQDKGLHLFHWYTKKIHGYQSAADFANAKVRGEAEAIFYESKVAAELGYTSWTPYAGQFPDSEKYPKNTLFKDAHTIMRLVSKVSAPTSDVISKLSTITPLSYYNNAYYEYNAKYNIPESRSVAEPLFRQNLELTVSNALFNQSSDVVNMRDVPTAHSLIQAMATFGTEGQSVQDMSVNAQNYPLIHNNVFTTSA